VVEIVGWISIRIDADGHDVKRDAGGVVKQRGGGGIHYDFIRHGFGALLIDGHGAEAILPGRERERVTGRLGEGVFRRRVVVILDEETAGGAGDEFAVVI